jgi:MFS family permease
LRRQIHFINFSRKFAVNTVFFLVPLYFLKIGLNGWQIGVVMSFFAFAPLLFSFPAGWINDRLSMMRVIQGALFALTLLFLALARIHNFFALATLFLSLGIANNALDVSMNSLYFKDETEKDLNQKFGRFNFWLALGTATGILLAGFLTYYANFQVLLTVYALFVFAVFLSIRNFNQAKFEVVPLREYKLNLFRKKTILFSILIFVLASHWGVEGTVYTPFLKKHFGLNNLQLAFYVSFALFFLALSSFSIGLLRFNPQLNKRLFLLAMLLSGLGLIFMVQTNVYLSFLFRCVHEIGDGFLGALVLLFISRQFEKRSIGGSSGALLAIQTMGHMAGALFFSPLGYKVGLQYPFFVAGALLVANSAFGYFVFRSEKY